MTLFENGFCQFQTHFMLTHLGQEPTLEELGGEPLGQGEDFMLFEGFNGLEGFRILAGIEELFDASEFLIRGI